MSDEMNQFIRDEFKNIRSDIKDLSDKQDKTLEAFTDHKEKTNVKFAKMKVRFGIWGSIGTALAMLAAIAANYFMKSAEAEETSHPIPNSQSDSFCQGKCTATFSCNKQYDSGYFDAIKNRCACIDFHEIDPHSIIQPWLKKKKYFKDPTPYTGDSDGS